MIIGREPLEMAIQAPFVESNDVIQALAANRADHPFDIATLPGRARGRKHLLDAHCLPLLNELPPEDPITIPQQIAGSGVPGKGFAQLLRGPLGGRMCCNSEMQDAPAVVSQHQKYVQDLERIVGTVKKSTETMLFT